MLWQIEEWHTEEKKVEDKGTRIDGWENTQYVNSRHEAFGVGPVNFRTCTISLIFFQKVYT
jgi:hypothetical protein